jgi:hypothetical protein
MNSVIRMSHEMVLVLTFVIANSLPPYVHGQTLNKTEQERADVVKVLRNIITIGVRAICSNHAIGATRNTVTLRRR